MSRFLDRIGQRGFGLPEGRLGWLGGRLMARGNAATERHMVELASIEPDEVVLVVGPGPGIGVREAARQGAEVVAVEPSAVMRAACLRRCSDLVGQGRVRLVAGTAERTGQPGDSADVVITVNNAQIWPDLAAGCAELARVLRPGGRLLLSAHRKWLPGGPGALVQAVSAAGFTNPRTWTWQPPQRFATTATQLTARCG